MLRKTQKAAAKRTGAAVKPKQRPAPSSGRDPGISRAPRPSGGSPNSNSGWSGWRRPITAGRASCLAAVCDVPLTGDDVAVLNVVRMGDEPKRALRDRPIAQPRRRPQSAIRHAKAGEGRPDRDRGLVVAPRRRATAPPRPATPSPSLCDLTRRDPAADAGGTRRLETSSEMAARRSVFSAQPSSASSIGGRVAARKVA